MFSYHHHQDCLLRMIGHAHTRFELFQVLVSVGAPYLSVTRYCLDFRYMYSTFNLEVDIAAAVGKLIV